MNNIDDSCKTLQQYRFALLQYRFDLSRDERANVGILLKTLDSSLVMFKALDNFSRLSLFFGTGFNVDGFKNIMENIAHSLSTYKDSRFPQLKKTRLDDIMKDLAPPGTCFIWSRIMSGVHRDVENRFDKLFVELVDMGKGTC